MSTHLPRRRRPRRSGTIIVLTLFLMTAMLGFVALAVDVGYLQVASSEMQRSADSAAVAAAWKLLDQQGTGGGTPGLDPVRSTAGQFAQLNLVCRTAPMLGSGDVEIGAIGTPYNRTATMTFTDAARFNAVKVVVRRDENQNGQVPLFFARVFDRNGSSMQSEATAMFLSDVAGFKTPENGETLDILPFALDKQTWDKLLAKDPTVATDTYKYDEKTGAVSNCSDGVYECNLYPQGTGSPGNRGTVDIGKSNNSTSDLSRQIRYGVSAEDLSYIGGKLELNPTTHTLILNGDTGISAGVKDDLAAIKGKPRVIPIFSTVSGPGNNAEYTIVGFAGVRIVYVKMTSSNKQVLIQPAKVILKGAIPSNTSGVSQFVYSPVWLVR
jgi:hypothetical protein